MSVSDPLGDMLTRIRNAYGRKKTSVSTPASTLRARVLEVLKSEGYIRDFSQTDFDNGKSEINIELKYFDGNPGVMADHQAREQNVGGEILCQVF